MSQDIATADPCSSSGRVADARVASNAPHPLDEAVTLARQGSHEAFGALWTACSPRIGGYLRSRGALDVDDATSEVFLDAFRSMPTFDGGGAAFVRWLFTLAHRRSVDQFRRARDFLTDDRLEPRETAPSAEQAVLDTHTVAWLQDGIDALTAEQRDVLLMRALGDLTLDEIAHITGRSRAAVSQLHKRAIGSLRRAAVAGDGPVIDRRSQDSPMREARARTTRREGFPEAASSTDTTQEGAR